ncbi:PAS domain S-box protein [candidate division KSB1 bacterium]|nr:MAG: PAS domain S-box protein [candidate division KSB1 bacterium]MBC6948774.1 PAS domain S-box protein [candidate division KSB1 bacterium]MCE7943707.1 PAS domain S-box protein [Chlorobi bacterium CHB1]
MPELLISNTTSAGIAFGIAAFLAIFAALFALHVYRAQSFAVFAGLFAAEVIKLFYLLTLLGQMNPVWAWTGPGSVAFIARAFLIMLSAFWLVFSFLAFHHSSPAEKSHLLHWSIYAVMALALIFGLTLGHQSLLQTITLTPSAQDLIRQFAAGICAGCFLLASVSAGMRWWRSRNALWIWLVLAALTLAATTALQFLLPSSAVSVMALLGLSSLLVAIGLFADRARFLRFEAELRKSLLENSIKLEEQLRSQSAAMALTHEAIAHLDLNDKIIFANENFLQLIGYHGDPPVGRSLKEIVSKEVYEAFQPLLREARRERSAQVEIAVPLPGGQRLMQASYAPIRQDNQRIEGLHLGLIDVTEYRRTEKSLQALAGSHRENFNIFYQAQANASDAMVITDLQYKISDANPAFERAFGFSKQEILAHEIGECFASDSFPLADIQRRLAQHKPWRGEVLSSGKDGRTFVSDLAVIPLAADEQRIVRYLWIAHDLTEQRKLENELAHRAQAVQAKQDEIAATRQYFESLLDTLNDIFIVVDTTGRCLYLNAPARERLGFSAEELTAKKLPNFLQEVQRLGGYGEAVKIEFREYEAAMQTRSGETITCLWSARPLFNAKKEWLGTLAIGREMDELKRLRTSADTLELEQKIQQRTAELQRRIDQLAKMMEIGEDIRLNVSLDVIMQAVANAISALGWQRVGVFHRRQDETYELVASAGFDERRASLPRKFLKISYPDLAPYLLERWRISQSFYLDARQLQGKRPAFLPASLDVFAVGDWHEHDCLLAPIRGRDKTIGMIMVFSPSDGRRPEASQVHDLELLADDAGLAIANSELLASHAASERQARLLAHIGNAFQAASTLEEVVIDIAGLMAQALSCPLVIVVRADAVAAAGVSGGLTSAKWVAAAGQPARTEKGRGRRLTNDDVPEKLLKELFEQTGRERERLVELEPAPWRELIAASPANDTADTLSARLIALRSRGRSFGFVLCFEAEAATVSPAIPATFLSDLIAQATLTIDNARLFHQTEEKAHELAHANQHISEFLASTSHELRTPLHAILQFSEILLDDDSKKMHPEQRHHLEIVQRSGKNLLALINDILDLSKIAAGKMEAILEDFDPRLMISEISETVRPLCEKKKLKLQINLADSLPALINSDRNMLTRALTNLLGNAVKFTEDGYLDVSAHYRAPALTMAVRDTGIGIPANRLKEIFEPFRQLEMSEARRHSGTGLGLAISQNMLAILGGRIEVVSKVGSGSTFTIHVPVKIPSPAEIKRAAGVTRKPAPAQAASSKKRRRPSGHILVVEDDENTRYAMQFILENEGYRVSFAEGEEAILSAQHERPNMILMDIMMPKMDGYQVARTLKAQKQLAHIPVVALTARAMKGDREKALAAGCDDYLTKPFEKKDILGMIAKWLE